MLEWEYQVCQLDTAFGLLSMRDNLNKQGAEGWELVSVITHQSFLMAIFKRVTTFRGDRDLSLEEQGEGEQGL